MSVTTATAGRTGPGPTGPGEESGFSQLGWALTDSWTMTRRELAHWARRPVDVVVGLAFPLAVGKFARLSR